MEKAKRARKAETLKQTKPFPKVARAVPLSRPWLEDHGVSKPQPQDQGHQNERDAHHLAARSAQIWRDAEPIHPSC